MLCEGCQLPLGQVNSPRAELPRISQAHDSKGSDQGYRERRGDWTDYRVGLHFTSALGNWLALGRTIPLYVYIF